MRAVNIFEPIICKDTKHAHRAFTVATYKSKIWCLMRDLFDVGEKAHTQVAETGFQLFAGCVAWSSPFLPQYICFTEIHPLFIAVRGLN